MKVFVSGADGMLGTNIVHQLLSRGFEVKALVHFATKSKTLDQLDIEKIKGNILDLRTYESQLAACDYVIHVAASTALWPGRNRMVTEVNVEGTKLIMQAAKKAGIKRFVHIGSASSFAPGTAAEPADETKEYNGWRFRNDYMDSKFKAQQLVLDACKNEGFQGIVVCPTYMIGEYDSAPTSGRLILSLEKGMVPAYSRGAKSYVHTADVATAAVNALEMGRLGEAYIAGGENLTYREFFEKVYNIVGLKFNMIKTPFPLVVIAGFFGSALSRVIGKPPKLSYGMARMSGMEQYYSSKKAIDELNMPQTPIDKAIKDCLAWMKANDVKI
jgi:dihydroflavonol-4-reductase